MHITIENAGAERGCLLLYSGSQLCIEAVGVTGSGGIEIIHSVPLSEMKIVPDSILNYCLHSEESVVVNDALNEERFSSDRYIQDHKVLSAMCLPITSKGSVNGLLYLENSLLKGVFNKNRIELLEMLSGQIGISIENALLYENLEAKVIERTKEIEKTLTELKSTQAQLIQAEKMASLGELTAGIAHEIQNPLNFVNNFSEVNAELIEEMREEMGKGNMDEVNTIVNDIAENQKRISQHGKRADAIVKGMLQHSRISTGQKEPTNFNALADEFLRLAYHGLQAKENSFDVTLKTDFDQSIGKISIVPQEIGRVLHNLINNAFYAVGEKKKALDLQGFQNTLDHSEYEPTVSVRTSRFLPLGGEGVTGRQDEGGAMVLLSVKDNGNGIPERILEKIFQPFFTTKPAGEGTGLGLSLSYDIVKSHGGEFNVSSVEGHGTEFTIKIPV